MSEQIRVGWDSLIEIVELVGLVLVLVLGLGLSGCGSMETAQGLKPDSTPGQEAVSVVTVTTALFNSPIAASTPIPTKAFSSTSTVTVIETPSPTPRATMTTLPGNESIPIEDVPLGEAILFETYQQAADQGWIALSWLAPLGEDKDPVDPIPVIFPTTFAPRIGSISPNGRYVLLLELNFPGGIPYIFDRETNEVKPLFEDYPWRGGIGFDWSMDSKKLVFWALDVGLWLIDVETTERIRLTIPDGPVQRASISPTGEQVAFIAASPTSLRALWVIDAVGGEPRWVIDINGSTRNFGWSTEGILYFGSVAGTTKGESSATGPLWVINAEGDQQRSYEIPLIFGFDFEPLLSPDRTQLAFTGLAPEQVPVCAEPGEQRDCLKPFLSVYLLDLTNDKLTNLGNGFNPTWSPDGHRLAFVSRRTAADELWIINTDGTGLRQLTNDGLFKEQGWWLKARE